MISRRQILGQQPQERQRNQRELSQMSPSETMNRKPSGPKQHSPSKTYTSNHLPEQQQQDMASNYYASAFGNSHENNHNIMQQPEANYRHFDPYSVHGEEDEDVWYSEERLFEDHLDEIFNKWRLLDDDIWCKLIIMERNRRIGKAYARVPIVTIDGSHELSYDGYKLALNGFDNPDRDSLTEECRKRIGKGIRIKMDNLGNIVIKRLSKSGVYVKDWLHFDAPAGNIAASNNQTGSGGGGAMPSRQQLIRNQLAASGILSSTNSTSSSSGAGTGTGKQQAAANSSSSSGGGSSSSSMEASNDSAVCDEILSLGGCLALNQIYYLFDMKKFQANITQELCRPYPDIRKLEQQCFSIIGLARDSEEILNLPVWVMVINIVAIEMLNERFPLMMDQPSSFPDRMLLEQQQHRQPQAPHSRQAPNFVSIFDRAAAGKKPAAGTTGSNSSSAKEEDPYSLPANVSSSDVKSSINDYGTASTRNVSSATNRRYYGKELPGYSPANSQARNQPMQAGLSRDNRSKSNCNIYGNGNGGRSLTTSNQANARLAADRYNSSIYSPGHMLVPPPVADSPQLPPKLPPRDFVSAKSKLLMGSGGSKSKSSSNVNQKQQLEEIYSTGLQQPEEVGAKPRKSKRNRFLESLKAPLELAKGSAGNRSASVLGAPATKPPGKTKSSNCSSANSTSGFAKSSGVSRNLKSFLGVSSSKNAASKLAGSEKNAAEKNETNSDDSNYIHLADTMALAAKQRPASNEADSVVDSSEEILDELSKGSYNDLDIPTPDYETDENIYGLEEPASGGYRGRPASQQQQQARSALLKKLAAGGGAKEDLYYSGFSAHVPQGGPNASGVSRSQVLSKQRSASAIQMEPAGQMRDGSRFAMAKLHKQPAPVGGQRPTRELIYGSASGIHQSSGGNGSAKGGNLGGARYRSASMQRANYPMRTLASHAHRSQTEMGHHHHQTGSGLVDEENPYALSYGVGDYPTAGQRRRPSASKNSKMSMLGQPIYGSGNAATAAAYHSQLVGKIIPSSIASNYDLGRSSSGIYGNNSSSSSSDYADWHPQMRKVNSSGYLNSIFKSQQQQQHHLANMNNNALLDSFTFDNPNNEKLNNNNSIHGYNNKQRSSTTSRALRSSAAGRPVPAAAAAPTGSAAGKQLQRAHQQQQQQNQLKHLQAGKQFAPTNGPQPAYRSYDSSNESEPSYTNSSDGLDIYDHIGARLNHNHQFLSDLPSAAAAAVDHGHLAPEVHVGEWENMYDR